MRSGSSSVKISAVWKRGWGRKAAALAILLPVLVFGLACQTALAEATPKDAGATVQTSPSAAVAMPLPLAGVTVPGLLGRIIKAVLGLSGTIGLVMFMYGGVMWMTASGNEEKITKAKNIIVWSVLGLIALFGSYIAVGFVIRLFQPLVSSKIGG